MEILNIIDSEYFTFLVLPILIFVARIIDQSIGIFRIIMATKGLKYPAFIAAFFESFIWLLAISQIMSHLNNMYCYLAFAFGFATGNVFGIYLENKISIGYVIMRVVFQKDASKTIKLLRQAEYRLTIVDAMGFEGSVKLVFSTIKRSSIKLFLNILNENNPTAFYSIEDVKSVKEGSFFGKKKSFRLPKIRK